MTWARRLTLLLFVATGLVFMNGGVGRAMTCAGMTAEMEAQLHTHQMQQHVLPTTSDHASHHPPADQPTHSLKQLGVGLPKLSGAGSAKSGRPALIAEPQHLMPVNCDQLTHLPPPTRDKLALDPVSELGLLRP